MRGEREGKTDYSFSKVTKNRNRSIQISSGTFPIYYIVIFFFLFFFYIIFHSHDTYSIQQGECCFVES